ncbi:MAG: ABC transporter substrate-binding protein [Candidatus Dormibacteria bacterium]
MPLLAAEENRLFALQNIEVEYAAVASSTEQFASLASGSYQLVHTAPDNVLNYRLNRGNALGARLPWVVIAGMDYGLGLQLVTRAALTFEDLPGKKLSVDAPESGYAYVAYALLARHGLRRHRDYEVVSHGGAVGRLERLLANQADATMLSGALAVRARQAGLGVLADVREVAHPYLGGVIATTEPWLNSHRELAVRLLRAFITATRWALDPGNGGRAQTMLARAYGMDDSAADALYAVEVQPGVGAVPDGAIPNQALRNVLVLRQHSGGFEEPHDLDALIDGPLVDRSVLADALAAM